MLWSAKGFATWQISACATRIW